MDKYIIQPCNGFPLLEGYKEIIAKNKKEAIKQFFKERKPDNLVVKIYADTKNVQPGDYTVTIFKGYRSDNGVFCKVGRSTFYNINTILDDGTELSVIVE